MSYWGEHSVHTVYCDINWLVKQIKIIKINNIFFQLFFHKIMSFWGEHSVHTVYCDLNWLAKQIKIIKIINIFFQKKSCHFGGNTQSIQCIVI